MSEREVRADGLTGQVEVSNDVINIMRKGLRAKLAQGKRGEVTIPVNRVARIDYKKPSFLTNGHIHFLLEGESKQKHSILTCPMTVTFNRRQEGEFRMIAEHVARLKEKQATESQRESFPPTEYELVQFSEEQGNGYVVQRVRDKQKLRHQTLPISQGLYAFDVAGTSYRKQALQDQAFAPGSQLAVIPNPDNPVDREALAVWDLKRRLHIGYVPKDCSRTIRKRIINGEPFTFLSMWENRRAMDRVGLRVLVVAPNASIKLPNE